MARSSLKSIDDTYKQLMSSASEDITEFASMLPFHLGLTKRKDGQWGDFVQYLPNIELPVFAAESRNQAYRFQLNQEKIDHYRKAHHCAVYCGILIDRIIDHQVVETANIKKVKRFLLRQWLESLSQAVGTRSEASSKVRDSMELLGKSKKIESNAFKTGSLVPDSYVLSIRQKMYWAGIASFMLLEKLGDLRRYQAFRNAYELLLIGLQCIDDARDEVEDTRLMGISYPALLSIPSRSLYAAASKFVLAAVDSAQSGGFVSFGKWLEAFHQSIDSSIPEPAPGQPVAKEILELLQNAVPDYYCSA